jgi:hypothetical protein
MNKIGLILAGAVVFDLGVVVTASHAAYDAFLKIDDSQGHAALKIKLDKVNDASVCAAHGGTVSVVGADQFCSVPAKAPEPEHTPQHMGY